MARDEAARLGCATRIRATADRGSRARAGERPRPTAMASAHHERAQRPHDRGVDDTARHEAAHDEAGTR